MTLKRIAASRIEARGGVVSGEDGMARFHHAGPELAIERCSGTPARGKVRSHQIQTPVLALVAPAARRYPIRSMDRVVATIPSLLFGGFVYLVLATAPGLTHADQPADRAALRSPSRAPFELVGAEVLSETLSAARDEFSSIHGPLTGSTSTSSTTSTTVASCDVIGGCGDPFGGGVNATGALYALQAAVGATSCLRCICDVDVSGAISATDALTILQAAVGQPVTLACPPCCPDP